MNNVIYEQSTSAARIRQSMALKSTNEVLHDDADMIGAGIAHKLRKLVLKGGEGYKGKIEISVIIDGDLPEGFDKP